MSNKLTGFPQIKMSGKGTFKPPTPKILTRDSEIGDYVVVIDKSTYMLKTVATGILREWDSNTAVIELADGTFYKAFY